MEIINTKKAPAAIGPYSQAYKSGNLVICSGQLPVDPSTGDMPSTIEEQAKQSALNVKAILEEAGSDLDHVIKTTCFLSDMADFKAFNEVYAKYFTKNPARSCVAVKEIPKNALCEIEAIAEIK